ncbi:hypothetical protein EBZ80_27680, partial [bacterium]|nr:hypothetical protein [bacterium]
LEPGVFLIPAHATRFPPPSSSDPLQTPVFRNGAWGFAQDHRGEIWYDPGTGMPVAITEFGDPALLGLVKDKPNLPAPVPPRISMAQCKAQLAILGVLDTVEAILAATSQQSVQGKVAYIFWQESYEVNRNSPLVNAMASHPSLNWNAAYVDDLFRQAAQIKV